MGSDAPRQHRRASRFSGTIAAAVAIGAALVVSCSSQSQTTAESQALPQTFTQGALEVRYPAGWHRRTVMPKFTQVTPSTAKGSPLVFSDSAPEDWADGAGPSKIWFAVLGPINHPKLDLETEAASLSSSREATDVQQGTRTIAGQDARTLTYTTTKAAAQPPGYRGGLSTFELDGQTYAFTWASAPGADPDGARINAILDAIELTASATP